MRGFAMGQAAEEGEKAGGEYHLKIEYIIFSSHGLEICTRELFLDIYQTLYKWLAHVRSIGLVTRLVAGAFRGNSQ